MSSDILPGMKVVFAFPHDGHERDRDHAAKHLKIGERYTVKSISVQPFATAVSLVEVPGESFNSVHFEANETTK